MQKVIVVLFLLIMGMILVKGVLKSFKGFNYGNQCYIVEKFFYCVSNYVMIQFVFIGLFFFNGLIGELIRKNGKINLIFIERSNGFYFGVKKDIIFSEFKFNL